MQCPNFDDPEVRASEESQVYRRALQALLDSGVPFLVGGTYAFACFTGIVRNTKDLDLFLAPADLPAAQAVLERAGFTTEVPFPHWLAKAHDGPYHIDLIFRAANGLFEVDARWYARGPVSDVLGLPVRLSPPEEILATKALLMERERYDGADVAHLVRNGAASFDWERLLDLFGPHWRVLLSHLVLFGFIYPGERDLIPAPVLETLIARLQDEMATPPEDERLCRGTLLSREQYLVDVEEWGYRDARLRPLGTLSAHEVRIWTEAIDEDHPR